jgi:hypothetical protein
MSGYLAGCQEVAAIDIGAWSQMPAFLNRGPASAHVGGIAADGISAVR